jgi:hypothetical protein
VSSSEAPPGPVAPRDDRPLWKRIAPFVIALALVGYVLHKLDLRTVIAHIRSVNYPAFLAFVAVFTVANLAADALATSYVYRRTVAPVKTREFLLIRGASYLPSLLNHHVGQAWLTWYMSQAYNAPLLRVTGATLLVYATTFGSLFLLGAMALLLDPHPQMWLVVVVAAGIVSGLGYLVVIRAAPGFLSRRKVLSPLFEVGVAGHLKMLALRLPHVIVLFFGTWLPFWFFGVRIPTTAALAYVPVLMVVQALPITPQGVGARDVFAQHYFSQFGPAGNAQAAVAATTLSFAATIVLTQIVFSLLLMQRALKALRRAGPENSGAGS